MVETHPDVIEEFELSGAIAEEPPYQVIIHNDDVTPMHFVIQILQQVFLLSGPRALQIMYTAHHHGTALVQVLPKGEALRRVHRAHFSARMAGFPLTFTVEKE